MSNTVRLKQRLNILDDDCIPQLQTPTPFEDGNEYINAVFVNVRLHYINILKTVY